MPRIRFRHALVAVLLLIALISQGTWALASTTGGLGGTVIQTDSSAPIANATVTASSPSQTATTTTDGAGRFRFLSLIPDTYTVSVSKEGFQETSVAGTPVFADATANVALRMQTSLTQIAKVTSVGAGNLVKRGTTADVYAINAHMQDKLSALGGGGGLNSAYSAIASVPGAFVPLNQTGYFQTVHIRGGDYDQVGYELDGVPVNRSFDNYPSGAASSLGQQQVQVYTGATPAGSEGQGLAGYINQVIKTGTYPGFASTAFGIGTPTFYHKLAIETGGSTPNRMFSYYVGIGGYNSGFRYVDQQNAAGLGDLAGPFQAINPGTGNCPAGPTTCWSILPYQTSFLAAIADRDVVMNMHFGIAHHNDGGHDDIQLLWDSGHLDNTFYSSTNDLGGPGAFAAAGAPLPTFADGFQWTCSNVGTTTNTLNPGCVTTYFQPNTPGHPNGGVMPFNLRDSVQNNQEIFKLQYQKNLGSDAFFRIYGYTYYSNWMYNGPASANANFIACCPTDYELSSHTRGVSAEFSKQFNSQNLVSLQGSYTTASSIRDNNTQMFNAGGTRSRGVVMVNANDPLAGFCFNPAGASTSCNPSNAFDATNNPTGANFVTWPQIQQGNVPALAPSCNIPSKGIAGPCTWLVAENSLWATYNAVTPKFGAISLQDEFRPNDKLLLNLGLRLDQFQFVGQDTNTGAARNFWYKAWNLDHCVNSSGAPVEKSAIGAGLLPEDACPAGFTNANMTNVSGAVATYSVFQPRLAGTYTFNPNTVVRFSAGKYVEPPNSAFEQYNTLEADTPFELAGSSAFYAFGFTSPGQHLVRPPTSLNYDISLEHSFPNTDISFKLTPFLRQTKDQIQQFFLDQKTGFVSGLNVGRQSSSGVEFQVNKGDFLRNGFSGQLSFAYTHSQITYDVLNNGSTVVTGINNDIAAYNQLTKNGGGSPCYTITGAATACVAGTVANPYYNAPRQALINAGAAFPTYDILPGAIGSSAQTFGAPYVGSMILNYRHDKLAITPSFQFVAGSRYGAPETTPGIDPRTCTGVLGSPTGDPRYPYGAAGGNAFNASDCGQLAAIPNPYTGVFDGLGAFVQPNQFLMNLQMSYDVSQKVTLVGTFANIASTCWGGTKAAWTLSQNNVCSYGLVNSGGGVAPVGNLYNPPATVNSYQRLLRYPYGAFAGAVNVDGNSTLAPFQFFLEARIKL
jgi:hypothetical protein